MSGTDPGDEVTGDEATSDGLWDALEDRARQAAPRREARDRIVRDAAALREEPGVTVGALWFDDHHVHVGVEPLPEGIEEVFRSRYGALVQVGPVPEAEGYYAYEPGPDFYRDR